jgi:hypothetical protein
MRVTFNYRNPTPAHCDVAVFVNGALAGTLRMRRDEVVDLRRIVMAGCGDEDFFVAHGSTSPGDRRIGDPLDRDYSAEWA